MHVSDDAFLAYLKRNERKQYYRRGDGAEYTYRLEPSRRPTDRMPYTIVFYAPGWEKDHEIAACFAIECLDAYNGGRRDPDRFVAKTGARSPSRRGRYLCELLRHLEMTLGDRGA
jgi:hypothetical protein